MQSVMGEATGSTIAGYRLERLLGGSATAQVYLGRHVHLGRQAAVKVLNPHLALDEEAMSRFFCEARAVAELNCEHLVDVIDFVFEPRRERVAYVMEYLGADDLRRVLDRQKRLPPARAVGIAAQLCEALAAAHAFGVVHRDVRPENVMLVRRGGEAEFVKLIDFGVAQFAGEVKHHTAAGMVLGSPRYMSPEAARGQRVDGRADLYSLGILLFEMLTGRAPFQAATSAQTIELHLHARAPSLVGDHGAGEVPKKLADVVKRCLAKSPDDRYEDAEHLRIALLDAAGLASEVGARTLSVSHRIGVGEERLSRRFLRQALGLKYSRAAALAAGTTLGLAVGYWLALALR